MKRVNEVISQELGPLVEDRSQWAKNRERFGLKDGAPGAPEGRERRKWPEEKIPIGLESMRNFNVRAKVVGPGVSRVSISLSSLLLSVLSRAGHVREIYSERDRYKSPD